MVALRVEEPLTQRLKRRYYGSSPHPYRIFERKVLQLLPPGGSVVDAGCGRGAPFLQTLKGRAGSLIGIDLEESEGDDQQVRYIRGDLAATGLPGGFADLVVSRSVLEHLQNPREVYREVHRVLRPEGHFVFLTPNLLDYSSIVARVVPNRLHPRIVSATEGRHEDDVFPTFYRSNTGRAIRRLASDSGFEVVELHYLGQYPAYLQFNPVLFLLGTAYDKMVCRYESLRYLRAWILADLLKVVDR